MLRLYSTVTSKRTISINGEVIFRDFLSDRSKYFVIRLVGRTLCSPSNKNRNPTYSRNQCRGEPYVRPPDNNRLRTYIQGQTFQIHSRT